RGVELYRAGDAWAFRTAPDLGDALKIERSTVRRLSRAAIETLAVIAYHQPVTRAEVEEIRGVGQSRGTLDLLLEAGWIKPGRRRQTPGRPLTWITTQAFLDHFGLENVGDLPGVADLKASGLLDKRPAIEAFRSAADGDAAVDAGEPESTEEDEEPAEAGADPG
ncbi:MAG: SMC-Scp complex subunit ScpB, partial [Rhodospirillaceae bacterium]|nr:SMC-Scp complex subunit ScpB [Rhodospirillaceae bacterium]